ncbi:hypothetical protein [Algicella marina]|uniref:Uncharacterized protein n=1 Tax=Algicella marina TaxID=2683284 RepID=A0A6P1T6A7_9RHOB|nr:hypothetical protein [Algicella marina]QHQ36799.1 hypothetical protein GO499_17245 [Algicella marina]
MVSLQKKICRMAVLAFSLTFFSTAVAADVVTVSVTNSPVVFVGRVVEEDATKIVIETRFGKVSLAKAEVECKGCSSQVFALVN